MQSTTRYRSNRAVTRKDDPHQTQRIVAKWSRLKKALVCGGALLLALVTLLPVIILESGILNEDKHGRPFHAPVSLHGLMSQSIEIEKELQEPGGVRKIWNKAKDSLHVHFPGMAISHVDPADEANFPEDAGDDDVGQPEIDKGSTKSKGGKFRKKDDNHHGQNKVQKLARGVSGFPMSQTPALIGAKPGHVECDVDVDDIVYWNDPQGTRDREFVSPFATTEEKYLTFEPDLGGWNNIRMSMEIIFVMALATGRTLVLPPKKPFYLLGTGKANAKSFGNFFPIHHPEFQKRLKVITMSEFVEKEGKRLLGLSDSELEKVKPVAELCLHKTGSEINCQILNDHLRNAGTQPKAGAHSQCLIFDKHKFKNQPIPEADQERIKNFCGTRKHLYYDDKFHEPKLIHWNGYANEFRLLNHFYAFTLFTDPVVDNYFKRFVRDFLHYNDQLFCTAGKIIHALNQEGGVGGWSSLHVRRGDLQYKKVKISAEEWYDNTKELWNKNEILFIATDERNKTFFDPIKIHNPVRFLDDYWDTAKLGELDPNFLGMIDTIVASHGRVFAGTWFSTFTGYINRLRGYLGHSMKNSWYGWLERKEAMQEWKDPQGNYGAREWPVGWVGIDGDEIVHGEGVSVVLDPESNVMPDIPEDTSHSSDEGQKKTPKLDIAMSDFSTDEGFIEKALSRGVAGRALSETPSLVGGKRGHIECEVNVDSLAYWNDPQGTRDQEFVSPFLAKNDEKYITFTTDRGGWNNVRMSMEIIFVIAAATGRTLVLPPKEPLYRLHADKKNTHRGFADFFPLKAPAFAKQVKIISMEEFVKREGSPGGKAPIPKAMKDNVLNSAAFCDKRKASKSWCGHIADYLAEIGHVPDARAQDWCIVFDKDVYDGEEPSDKNKGERSISHFCGERKRLYWTPELQDKSVIHFRAGDKQWRLLAHFFGIIHFTDPAIDNFYKRFVRDFLHYNDQIYCAAGKIVKALQVEAKRRGSPTDEEGGGGYSAMHIRRGDFQYKKVKIPAEEWYENTKEVWQPNEIIYIATDERNKTFFDPIAQHHTLRFLDDYFELAGLGDLDPNYFGMIDTIVSSRARAFAGTWFSTFTGYINRMRGYHGMTMKDSWYSFLERKTKMHEWVHIDGFAYAYEWPDGWIGIDADVVPEKDKF